MCNLKFYCIPSIIKLHASSAVCTQAKTTISTSLSWLLQTCTRRERERQLLALYSTVSEKEDILLGGMQNKAFNWILTKNVHCVWPPHKGCELVKHCTMVVYYHSTNGENWANRGASSATCDLNSTILQNHHVLFCRTKWQQWSHPLVLFPKKIHRNYHWGILSVI